MWTIGILLEILESGIPQTLFWAIWHQCPGLNGWEERKVETAHQSLLVNQSTGLGLQSALQQKRGKVVTSITLKSYKGTLSTGFNMKHRLLDKEKTILPQRIEKKHLQTDPVHPGCSFSMTDSTDISHILMRPTLCNEKTRTKSKPTIKAFWAWYHCSMQVESRTTAPVLHQLLRTRKRQIQRIAVLLQENTSLK